MQISMIKTDLVLAMLAIALAGCASTSTPRLDASFGDAVNAAKAQQTANPEASLNSVPPNGIDGEAANALMDRYHKSFEKPPATGNIFNIGVGSGTGSGSGSSGSSSGAITR